MPPISTISSFPTSPPLLTITCSTIWRGTKCRRSSMSSTSTIPHAATAAIPSTEVHDRHLRCYESSYSIMLNLNRSWAAKQGDFFVESPTILFAAIIWFLRVYKDGQSSDLPPCRRVPQQALRADLSHHVLLSRTRRTTSVLSSMRGWREPPTEPWDRSPVRRFPCPV